jgi:hypothetical protein
MDPWMILALRAEVAKAARLLQLHAPSRDLLIFGTSQEALKRAIVRRMKSDLRKELICGHHWSPFGPARRVARYIVMFPK